MNLLNCLAAALLTIHGSKARDASFLLTKEKITEAVIFHQEEFNDGLPFIGGGMSADLESGETIDAGEIKMLATFLYMRKQLPDLAQLLPLLEHPNMACRIFCWNCLKMIFKDLPAYSPYFPPGSEPQQVSKVRAGIVRQIEINRKKADPPGTEASPSQRDDS